MGLLDFSGFTGDDTVKDEYGMTQADRRQPLFSGLIRGGMLAMAAGENISSAQRAQLLGQVGGAYADIPEAMNKAKAEAAQMQLRRQQFMTGQAKLEQARKIQAYAQTPEFAEMMKGLPQHIQFGLKTALEAGDVDHFTRLMGTVEAHRNDRTGIPVGYERDPATGGIRKMPGFKDEVAGPFPKTGDGPYLNLIHEAAEKNDPAAIGSLAYYMAYVHLAKARQYQDQETGKWINLPAMDMRRFPVPTYKDPATGQPAPVPPVDGAGGAPGAPGAPASGAPAPGTPAPGAPGAPPPAPAEPPPGTPVPSSPATPKPAQPLSETTIQKIGEGLSIFDQVEELRKELSSGKDLWVGGKLNQAARAAGIMGDTASAAAQQAIDRANPEGTRARALIASLTADKIKALSGTAAGEREVSRLLSLLPQPDDSPENIRTKLELMERQFDIIMKTHHGNIDPAKHRMPEGLEKRYGQKGGGGKRKVSRFNPQTGKIEEVEVD